MMIREKTMLDVRYDAGSPEFIIFNGESGTPVSVPWIVRDVPGIRGKDPMDIEAYLHEICAILVRQIGEFEALDHKADKQEQKRLQTTLTLALEAQELLYDDEE